MGDVPHFKALLNARKYNEINYVFFQLVLIFLSYLPALIKGRFLKKAGWVRYLFPTLLCSELLKQW